MAVQIVHVGVRRYWRWLWPLIPLGIAPVLLWLALIRPVPPTLPELQQLQALQQQVQLRRQQAQSITPPAKAAGPVAGAEKPGKGVKAQPRFHWARGQVRSAQADTSETTVQSLLLSRDAAQRGDWISAAAGYRQLLQAQPDNVLLHYNLAVSLEHLQQRTEAMAHYRRVIALADYQDHELMQARKRLQLLQGAVADGSFVHR